MQRQVSKLLNTRAESQTNSSKVQYSFQSDSAFPLVINPAFSGLILTEWIKENKELFYNKLHIYGGILLRGFEIDTVEKFESFIAAFDCPPLEYRNRTSPRYEVARNIYHSTTYPADQSISMHSENSYAVNWAMKIIFCCIQPATEDGQTPIADNRKVLEYISEATREKFLKKGLKYVRNISPGLGLSWQETFQTQNKKDVEDECRINDMNFSWQEDDKLVLSWYKKAIYTHPETKEKVWFNHSIFFNKYALNELALSTFQSDDELPFNTCFGDGDDISKDEFEEIKLAYEKATVVFPWHKGDVLFLDNMLVSHGRKPYKGDRKVIVSML